MRSLDAKGLRDAVDVVKADVPLATLDLAYVRTVEVGPVCQILLAPLSLAAKFAYAATERDALRELLLSYGGHYSTVGE